MDTPTISTFQDRSERWRRWNLIDSLPVRAGVQNPKGCVRRRHRKGFESRVHNRQLEGIVTTNTTGQTPPNPPGSRWKTKEEQYLAADGLALQADLLAAEGRFEEALGLYDRALALEPCNADLWVFKAITLSGGLHRDREAMLCWEQAQKLDPAIRTAFSIPEEENREPVHVPAHKTPHRDSRDKLRRFFEEEGK